jgi:hypothetical protein
VDEAVVGVIDENETKNEAAEMGRQKKSLDVLIGEW